MLAVCSIHFMFHGFTGTEAAVHELSHGTPFKSRWLNELFYRLFCFLSWSNWVHFRASHMLHLRFTGTAPRVPGRYSEDHVYPEAAAARSRLLLRPGVSANRCFAQICVLNLPTVILHACLTLCGR